jgi:methylase of polypeptide subunit release factors
MKSITALLEQAGFTDVQTYRDLSGTERVIGGSNKAGGHLVVLP